MKLVYSGAESVIVFEKEISNYYNLPFADMYNDLQSIAKETYSKDERIIITAYGETEFGIWKHFFRIVEYLNIPTYFVHFFTNNSHTEELINTYCKDIVNCTINDVKILKMQRNTRFDYPDTICITPFTNLEIKTNGDYRSCCQTSHYFYRDKSRMNILSDSVIDAWKSKDYESFREDFLSGKKSSYCDYCWKSENVGLPSKRTRDLKQPIAFTTDFFNVQNSPSTVDLKIGFSCNSKCRICFYGRSSAWYKEDKKFGIQRPELHEVDYTFKTTSEFWRDFGKDLQELKSIKLIGGEPMLDTKHIALLKTLPKNISISYNTNGTIYNNELVKELLQFQKVTLVFSIDNINEKFSYERHGTVKWDIVEENIEKYNKCNFDLHLHCTVSIFNVLDLDDVAQFALDNNLKISFNFLSHPEYFSVYNIKNTDYVAKKLKASKFEYVQNLANKFKDYIYHGLEKELMTELDIIDARRNENFKETYPEIAKIVSQF